MKKFLSLVLALVMTMSLVTISAGAKDFTDDETITYDEAVAVMSAVKVIDGYTDDSFKPTATLTRGAAAKIICNLILGPTTAAELPASVAPFKDVPANSTFAGYIAYCAKEGIVGGYADGTFKPGASLTGYAFMKMLLGALGYDAEIEGYNTPDTWSISVAKQALGIGLNAGLREDFNGVKAVTREEACLYAFNTLRATMVDYEAKTTVNVGDATVTVAGSTAKPVTWSEGRNYDGNIKKDGFVQFAEQYFTKLEEEDVRDVFGRPSRKWDYKGDEIDTYVNHDLLVETYTEKVTGKDLYNLLGSSTIKDYDIAVYVDGETEKAVLDKAYFTAGNLIKTNTETVGATGNGVLTEVYVNSDTKDVTIAIINTYLAEADDDYNSKKEEASFTVYGIKDGGDKQFVKDTDKKTGFKVANDDINVEDVKDGDMVLVQVAEGEIQTIGAVETLDEVTITKFVDGKSITTGGEDYKYASSAMYDPDVLDDYIDQNLKDTSYNVFLDQYGYLIGIEIVEEASKYLFLTGMDGASSNLTNKTVDANVIFLDGTMDTVKVNMTKSEKDDQGVLTPDALMNTWCTYTVDKNGVYTLTQVADDATNFGKDEKGTAYTGSKTDKVGQGKQTDVTTTTANKKYVTIDKKHVTLDGIASTGFKRVYGNDSSVYISAETSLVKANAAAGDQNKNAVIISGVDSVNTGIQTTSLEAYNAAAVKASDPDYAVVTDLKYVANGVYTLFKDNGYVIAAIVVGEDAGSTSNYAYVTSKSNKAGLNQEAYDSETGDYTWTRDVIVNGEAVELTEVTDGTPEIAGMTQNHWYEVRYFADGTVRRVTDVTSSFANANGKFVSKIEKIEPSFDAGFDPVILFEDLTVGTGAQYKLTVKGNTLQVDTTTASVSRGFAVAPSAKIVLVQDVVVVKDGVAGTPKVMDDIFEYDNGAKGLEKAINDVNKNNKFNGYISAVIEGGLATSVVIYDQTASDIDAGNQGTDTSVRVVDAARSNYYVGARLYAANGKTLTAVQKTNILANTIRADGYRVTSVDASRVDYVDEYGTYHTIYAGQIDQVYKVSFKTVDDSMYTVSTASDYFKAGETVTVTLGGGNWSAVVSSVANKATPVTGNAFGLSGAPISGSTDIKVTVAMTTLVADDTVVFGW